MLEDFRPYNGKGCWTWNVRRTCLKSEGDDAQMRFLKFDKNASVVIGQGHNCESEWPGGMQVIEMLKFLEKSSMTMILYGCRNC